MHQLVGSFEAQQKGMNEFASRPYKHFNPKLAGLKWIHIGTRKERGFRKKTQKEDEKMKSADDHDTTTEGGKNNKHGGKYC